MALASDSLPDDIEGLRVFAIQAVAERDAAIAERDNAIAQNDRLRHLLHKANDALYGSKSEQLAKLPPDQLHLALEDIEQAIAKNEAVEEKKARTRMRRAGAGRPIVVRCPPICRASTRRSRRKTRTARVVMRRCM